MGTQNPSDDAACSEATAKDHLKQAESELQHAGADLKKAEGELRHAETELRTAEAEVEAAEHQHREIEVKVDGQIKRVPRGTYVVAEFKKLVGVAADRELDIVHHDVFKPLDDNAEITIHQHEVFVSHVRTGASS